MTKLTPREVTEVRRKLKAKYPNLRLSVRGGNTETLDVSIVGGVENFKDILDKHYKNQVRINHYDPDAYGEHGHLFEDIVGTLRAHKRRVYPKDFFIKLSLGRPDQPYKN